MEFILPTATNLLHSPDREYPHRLAHRWLKLLLVNCYTSFQLSSSDRHHDRFGTIENPTTLYSDEFYFHEERIQMAYPTNPELSSRKENSEYRLVVGRHPFFQRLHHLQ